MWEKDRQTDKQKDREIDRQRYIDGKTKRQTEKRQKERKTD